MDFKYSDLSSCVALNTHNEEKCDPACHGLDQSKEFINIKKFLQNEIIKLTNNLEFYENKTNNHIISNNKAIFLYSLSKFAFWIYALANLSITLKLSGVDFNSVFNKKIASSIFLLLIKFDYQLSSFSILLIDTWIKSAYITKNIFAKSTCLLQF